MPPHCDTLDGPVVQAARKALDTGNVNYILPWVYAGGESKLREAFEKAQAVRKLNQSRATELADYWFFETAVRIHREGEGAAYTGLKPAGLDFGPILPIVDKSIGTGNPEELIRTLQHATEHSIKDKFEHVKHSKGYDTDDVDAARNHVNAYLGLALYSHHLYENINADVHAAEVEKNAAEKNKQNSNKGHHH